MPPKKSTHTENSLQVLWDLGIHKCDIFAAYCMRQGWVHQIHEFPRFNLRRHSTIQLFRFSFACLIYVSVAWILQSDKTSQQKCECMSHEISEWSSFGEVSVCWVPRDSSFGNFEGFQYRAKLEYHLLGLVSYVALLWALPNLTKFLAIPSNWQLSPEISYWN